MKIDIYDILIFLGLIILGTGLWLISPAVSLCTFGILIFFLGIAGASKKGGVSK